MALNPLIGILSTYDLLVLIDSSGLQYSVQRNTFRKQVHKIIFKPLPWCSGMVKFMKIYQNRLNHVKQLFRIIFC